MKTDRKYCLPRSGGIEPTLVAAALTFLIVFIIKRENFLLEKGDFTHSIPSRVTEVLWKITTPKTEEKMQRYTDASVDVPENLPDDTNLFSFRDQQAAQEELSKNKIAKNVPESQGKGNLIRESKIISPNSSSRIEPHASNTLPQPQNHTTATGNKNIQEIEGALGGTGSYLSPSAKKSKVLDLRNPQTNSQAIPADDFAVTENLTRLRNRPRVSINLTEGMSAQNLSSAPRKGKLAVECRLHPFGVYVQKMMKSIRNQWFLLISDSSSYLRSMPTPQAFVYRFQLNANGEIWGLELDKNPFEDALAAELCRQAIASRAPFGKWNPEMIQDFGHSDQITIRFEYL